MEQQVIVLNGPSSSGKSTLAGALQSLIAEKRSERYEIVSIDDYLKMSPSATIYEDDVFNISDDLCKRALEITKTGTGVIIDHVMTSARIFEALKRNLSSCQIRLVRVTCPLHLLRERELARGDRHPGSAEASEAYLFPREGYDLVVDTGTRSPAENSMRIFETLLAMRTGRSGWKRRRSSGSPARADRNSSELFWTGRREYRAAAEPKRRERRRGMERIIFSIITIPIAALFTGLGIYAMRREKPMWFWSGSSVRPEEITDIPAYNRANGWMWLAFSGVFWLAAVLALLGSPATGPVLGGGMLLGIPALIAVYNQIYAKYRKRK